MALIEAEVRKELDKETYKVTESKEFYVKAMKRKL